MRELANESSAQPDSPQIEVPGGAASAPPRVTRGRGLLVAALVLVVLAAAPLFLAPFATTTLTRIVVFALFAVSLDLLVGVTGMPSLGHAGYFGVGAYAAGWVSINVTAEVPVPLLVGAVFGALAAAATGWITVRTSGVFFLMLTLAIGETLQQLADSWESVTGGANGLAGIPATRVAGAPLTNAGYTYWYVLVAATIGFVLIVLLARSPFGAALRGIRDNEPRMRALGYATALYKYAVFVVAGGMAGVAGALLVAQQRLVTPADLGFMTASFALLAVIIGGAGSLWGACLGAALVIIVRDALGPSLDGHGTLVLGIVFVLVVYLLPRGAAGIRLFEEAHVSVLALRGALAVLRCAQGRRRRRSGRRARRPARAHRAQRGRQVHDVQAGHRHDAGRVGHRGAGREGRLAALGGAALPARHEPDAAAREPLRVHDGDGDGGAGRAAA